MVMTKQEEIRKGTRSHLIRLYTRCFGKEPEGLAFDYIEHCLKNIEMWQDSQDVVIKVDSRLSILHKDGAKIARLVKKAGYVAVEPLIQI